MSRVALRKTESTIHKGSVVLYQNSETNYGRTKAGRGKIYSKISFSVVVTAPNGEILDEPISAFGILKKSDALKLFKLASQRHDAVDRLLKKNPDIADNAKKLLQDYINFSGMWMLVQCKAALTLKQRKVLLELMRVAANDVRDSINVNGNKIVSDASKLLKKKNPLHTSAKFHFSSELPIKDLEKEPCLLFGVSQKKEVVKVEVWPIEGYLRPDLGDVLLSIVSNVESDL